MEILDFNSARKAGAVVQGKIEIIFMQIRMLRLALEDLWKDSKEILSDFCISKTGKALYDESTKL